LQLSLFQLSEMVITSPVGLPPSISLQINAPLVPYHKIREEYSSGMKKQELTQWWLDLIETRIEAFLAERKFDDKAVPFNYIDQPPTSLEAIRKNLQIIHHMMALHEKDEYQIRQLLIEPLQKEIYSKIDEFLRVMKYILWNELKLLQNGTEPSLDLGFARFQEMKTFLPKTKSEQLENMFHDINYILQMKKLEENFWVELSVAPGVLNRKKVSDIVPITGLIMGKLHRIENELKTVLDHWGNRGSSNRFHAR